MDTSGQTSTDCYGNCLVCGQTLDNHSSFINVFENNLGTESTVQQRLENVLGFKLVIKTCASSFFCVSCQDKLSTIERLTDDFRTTYIHTQATHLVPPDDVTCQGQPDQEVKATLKDNIITPDANDGHQVAATSEQPQEESCSVPPGADMVTTPVEPKPPARKRGRPRKVNPANDGHQVAATSEQPQEESCSVLPGTDMVTTPVGRKPPARKRGRPRKVNPGTATLNQTIPKKRSCMQKEPKQNESAAAKPEISGSENNSENLADLESCNQAPASEKNSGQAKPPRSRRKQALTHIIRKQSFESREQENGSQMGGVVKSSESGSHVCNICSTKFKTAYRLTRHLRTHSGDRPFHCKVCSKRFADRYHLTRHSQTHTGIRPHKCEHCSATFRERKKLEEHIYIHTGEMPFTCDLCDAKFSRAEALKIHIWGHTGAWPHKCVLCGAGFARAADIRHHMLTHTGEKPYACIVCSQCFRCENTLKVHLRTHTGEKPYRCDQCPATFSVSNGLKEHIRTHSGKRTFLCDTCGASFVHQSGLHQHSKIHGAPKNHVCPNCPKAFLTAAILRRHIRIHTGERPYLCTVCGKGFKRPGELSTHHRYHSGDRPHQCVQCNKRFVTKTHLKRHLLIHAEGRAKPALPTRTNLKQFKYEHACTVCGRHYPRLETLMKHMAKQHPVATSSQNTVEPELAPPTSGMSFMTVNTGVYEDLGLGYIPINMATLDP